MTYIPSCEIKQPQLHADTLGFTFVWQGHFLRGIYPESVSLAKSYFESGFIKEITEKGLFPGTWISNFENEQFGMIIEHEMISPVLYATEWNFEMLKDAAIMVLNIAQIGLKYGFNMEDCHKLNVMFKDNRPVYVDLGSFIPNKEGSTGWNPYTSFLRSYYNILYLWSNGAPTLAKRMMAPGLELDEKDYYSFKYPLLRKLPKLIKYIMLVREGLCRMAVWDYDRTSKSNRIVGFVKPIINILKLSSSQRLYAIEKRVKKLSLPLTFLKKENTETIQDFLLLVKKKFPNATSITLINKKNGGYQELLSKNTQISKIYSIQEDGDTSSAEYIKTRNLKGYSCSCFKLLNNSVLIRDRYPESRLSSEIAYIPQIIVGKSIFGTHNATVFIEHCLLYAQLALIIRLAEANDELIESIRRNHKVEIYESFNNMSNIEETDRSVLGKYLLVYNQP